MTPTENTDIRHEAAGNLAFLLSVIRCGETLSEAEEKNVRRVIQELGESQRKRDSEMDSLRKRFIEADRRGHEQPWFGSFVEWKYGPIGNVLRILSEGRISVGKAAESIAEIAHGKEAFLPDTPELVFADDEFPGEVVKELRATKAELLAALKLASTRLPQLSSLPKTPTEIREVVEAVETAIAHAEGRT